MKLPASIFTKCDDCGRIDDDVRAANGTATCTFCLRVTDEREDLRHELELRGVDSLVENADPPYPAEVYVVRHDGQAGLAIDGVNDTGRFIVQLSVDEHTLLVAAY